MGGVYDIRSGAEGVARNGTEYRTGSREAFDNMIVWHQNQNAVLPGATGFGCASVNGASPTSACWCLLS